MGRDEIEKRIFGILKPMTLIVYGEKKYTGSHDRSTSVESKIYVWPRILTPVRAPVRALSQLERL